MSDQDGRETPDPLDVTRLAAFLGDVKAQEVVRAGDFNPCCCAMSPCRDDCWEPKQLGVWLTALSRLLAKLPPHRLLVNSTRPLVYALDRRVDSGLVEIKTNWPHDTPAEQWLLADAALAVAWECHAKDCAWCGDTQAEDSCDVALTLLAGQAWVEEPTREREESWASAMHAAGAPAWAPYGGFWVELPKVLQAAATVIGAARVREVATASILARLLWPAE